MSRGRQQHNFSATIEASSSGVDYEGHSERNRQRFIDRKRSMPPAAVHIPLLDFSKLHQPQQPAQARGQKAMQPKQYQSLQPKYAESKNHHLYAQSLQQAKTQQQTSQQPYQKKRNSYELYNNSQKQQMNNSNGLWAGSGNNSTHSINQQILLKGAHEQSSTPAYQGVANAHQHSTSTSQLFLI